MPPGRSGLSRLNERSDVNMSDTEFKNFEHFRKIGTLLKTEENPIAQLAKAELISDEDESVLGYLMPMTNLDKDNDDSALLLMTWRLAHQYAYPTKFTPTLEGTKKWLENAVLRNQDRILFWLVDSQFRKVGHIGAIYSTSDRAFEVDNVLRGEPISPGLMSQAMRALESWLEEEFSAETVQLRVLKSNQKAVSFYKKLGYSLDEETALTEVKTEFGINLVSGIPAVDYFLKMSKSILSSKVPKLILTAGPSIGGLERAFGIDAISNGWNSQHSDYLAKFESSFAESVGSKYAMATSSCTGALHLSLMALGIGPGDEVIVPEVTWVATASAVMYVGATPVFADVDPDTWMLTSASVEAVITSKTRAIMPVHLYGFGAPMTALMATAAKYGLAVVEDAAPAIGTLIDGQAAGTFGDLGCYSFQGAKMLVTGEGGMLVTDDESLFARVRKLQDHGRKPGTFWIEELGYKYKMSNATAAIGLGQIIRSPNQIHRKQRIRQWYEEELSNVNGISFQREEPGTRSIHWMTSIKVSPKLGIDRDGFILALRHAGIDSRPVFPAISQYPFWPQRRPPKSDAKVIGESSINLPSGVLLSRPSVAKIGEVIRKLVS